MTSTRRLRKSLPRRFARKAGKKSAEGVEGAVEEGCGCGCLGDGCLSLVLVATAAHGVAGVIARRRRRTRRPPQPR